MRQGTADSSSRFPPLPLATRCSLSRVTPAQGAVRGARAHAFDGLNPAGLLESMAGFRSITCTATGKCTSVPDTAISKLDDLRSLIERGAPLSALAP